MRASATARARVRRATHACASRCNRAPWWATIATACAASAAIAAGAPAVPPPPPSAAATEPLTVVAAEYAFARAAAATNVKAAFLRFLAPDAVVCAPLPVRGVAFYAASEPNADRLEWYPALSDTAPSGDLGWTSGPWRFRSADGRREAQGTVLSMWRRRPDGAWRVELDCGIPHAPTPAAPRRLPEPVDSAPPAAASAADANDRPRAAPPALAPTQWREPVAEVEARFSVAVAQRGIDGAMSEFGAPDVRAMIAGKPPADGLDAAKTLLASSIGARLWQSAFSTSSRDGLLGYAWGYAGAADAPRPAFAYVNVWRREAPTQPWKIVVTVGQELGTGR